MKKIFQISAFLAVYVFWPAAVRAASTDAVFLSVYGKVTVKDTSGNSRTVQTNSKAVEGETVLVAEDAKTTLVFFDGSKLEAKPHTQFVLAALRQPASNEKIIQFNLLLGGLVARVQKLFTSDSLFEISAGGVVCGVRGTEFSVDYAPDMEKVDLKVIEGSVYARARGQSYTIPAGQHLEFIHGRPQGPEGQWMPSGKSKPSAASLGAVAPPNPSLALVDLDNQFTGILSINSRSHGGQLVAAPALGSSLQVTYPASYQLLSLAGPVQIVLPTLPLPLNQLKLAP